MNPTSVRSSCRACKARQEIKHFPLSGYRIKTFLRNVRKIFDFLELAQVTKFTKFTNLIKSTNEIDNSTEFNELHSENLSIYNILTFFFIFRVKI